MKKSHPNYELRRKVSLAIREEARKHYRPSRPILSLLKELYDTMFYDPNNQVKLSLINKYESKVSKRLLALREDLKIQGKKERKEIFQKMVY